MFKDEEWKTNRKIRERSNFDRRVVHRELQETLVPEKSDDQTLQQLCFTQTWYSSECYYSEERSDCEEALSRGGENGLLIRVSALEIPNPFFSTAAPRGNSALIEPYGFDRSIQYLYIYIFTYMCVCIICTRRLWAVIVSRCASLYPITINKTVHESSLKAQGVREVNLIAQEINKNDLADIYSEAPCILGYLSTTDPIRRIY